MGKKLKSDETLYTGETLRGGEREVTEARRASPETCLATRVMIVRPAGCNCANELRCVDWMLKTERRRVIADAAFGGTVGRTGFICMAGQRACVPSRCVIRP